jgi:hypothetical protein
MNDETGDFIESTTRVTPSDAFRADILQKTCRVVRRRRQVRRFGVGALLLGVYAAGALTMRWVQPPAAMVADGAPSEAAVHEEPRLAQAERAASPLALEWQAIDSSEGRAELFRRAGDRYLSELGDVEGALRCYRNFLSFASPADAKVGPDDSWLMISLKQSMQKETSRESLGS